MKGPRAATWLLLAALLLPAPPQDPVAASRQQFDAGRYADAVRTLESVLAQNPGDARLEYWLGRCYHELREVDKAVTHLERATELDAKNSEYFYWLGQAYGRKASRDRSLSLARKTKRAYEQAVRTDPNHIAARRSLADYLAQAPWIAGGSDSGARQQCEAVGRLDAAEGHLCWKDYWVEEKNLDRAQAECRRVLELKPSRVEPYLEVAGFFERRGHAAAMEQAVEAAAAVSPGDLRLGYYRAVAQILAGNRLSEAEKLLQNYLADAPSRSGRPSHAAANEWLGKLYERMNRKQEAIERYRASVQLEPRRKSAQEALERLEKRG